MNGASSVSDVFCRMFLSKDFLQLQYSRPRWTWIGVCTDLFATGSWLCESIVSSISSLSFQKSIAWFCWWSYFCVFLPSFQFSLDCQSGCQCPLGLLDDGRGHCVKPDNCPCKHDGQFYAPGSEITVDCNKWCVKPWN